jgi:urate oxidase
MHSVFQNLRKQEHTTLPKLLVCGVQTYTEQEHTTLPKLLVCGVQTYTEQEHTTLPAKVEDLLLTYKGHTNPLNKIDCYVF